jgi:hypothetical protein
MALKSALDLGLADAIHHHGGAATLPVQDLLPAPSRARAHRLRRLRNRAPS